MSKIQWRNFDDPKKLSQPEIDEMAEQAINRTIRDEKDPWIRAGDTIIMAHCYADGDVEVMDCQVRRIGLRPRVERPRILRECPEA